METKGRALKKMAASLTALGAGALAAAGTAEANVVYSGAVPFGDVGFAGGLPFYYSGDLGNSTSPSHFFFIAVSGTSPRGIYSRGIIAYACSCFRFATKSSLLQLFNAGATWGQRSSSYGYAGVGRRRWGPIPSYPYYTANNDGRGPFQDQYALFAFDSGPDTFYGWVHLSYTVNPQPGFNDEFGPDLIVHDWAYGDPGVILPAGQAPEPATTGTTALAALALGAVGLRNWRKNRKAA